MKRLTNLPTLGINPDVSVSIDYRGKKYQGVGGDTIATALYAGGVRVFGRSLKYHRPRGLYSLDGECGNTLMEVNGEPNVRTENTPAVTGQRVSAQNVVGSADRDFMSFMDKMSFAMPAGFYYKTMHKPAMAWPKFIPKIRKAAGLGKISADFEMPGVYDEIYPRTDVVVIGGGPAGMSAALAAAESGLRVIIIEARPVLGGHFDYRGTSYDDDTPLYQRARDLAGQVEKTDHIRVFTQAGLAGVYNNHLVTAIQRGGEGDQFDGRYIEIRATSIVVATGCMERPLLFDGNERPGIMQAGCAHRLARTYGILPGENAVFSVGDDLGVEAAMDLAKLGMNVALVADVREDGQDPELVKGLNRQGIPFLRGWTAKKSRGAKQIEKMSLCTLNGVTSKEVECDLLVASAGLTPITAPVTMAQGTTRFDARTGFFLPETIPAKMHVAGRIWGLTHPKSIEASGRVAGLKAAADCGADVDVAATAKMTETPPGPARGSKFVMAPVKGKKTFICFDEDCTVKNIHQAMTDGFDVPELIKRYTSAGTGPGQGGIPGHNLPLVVAQNRAEGEVSYIPTTVRAPLVPGLMAAFAGANHDMVKRTPMHERQVKDGGVMERIGVWVRARRFSDDLRAKKEIDNVRNNVGLLDASTLGKIRIFGPDALKALQRVYVSDLADLKKGRVRYSAMCNEDGCIVDDGVVIKMDENDYYLTTSTGRAGRTVEWFRYHTRYDGWDFHMVNLTDAFGVINMAGPNSRKVLEKVTDADVGNKAFPYAGYRELTIRDAIPVRAMRLGFVGELSFEFHAASSDMDALWDILLDAGKEFGIRNFGLEAQSTLRMEKGHIIIGSESEQRTTLHDVGLSWLWDEKPEAKTVGAVALAQTKNQKGRLKLVGFRMKEISRAAKDGSPVVDEKIRGYVCQSRYSKALKSAIGMALVEDHLAGKGAELSIYEDGCNGDLLTAEVVSMPFYDPGGKAQKI